MPAEHLRQRIEQPSNEVLNGAPETPSRRLLLLAAACTTTPPTLTACSSSSAEQKVARALREPAALGSETACASLRDLVRQAVLAPSSHNTQCWRFQIAEKLIAIAPDLARRCPVVDPDDHPLFGDYNGQPISATDLRQLERAGTGEGVGVRLLTARAAIEGVLAYTVAANTAQMNHPAFVAELKAWMRFGADEALRTGGRCCERFALQASALGIRNAFLNQPVEVRSVRPQFASWLGLKDGERPDLVVRFGRGPAMPWSMRRPVQAVLV